MANWSGPLLLLMLLNFAGARRRVTELAGYIVKGIGSDKINVTNFGIKSSLLVHYVLDLYPNQFIEIDFRKGSSVDKIEPLGELKYYTELPKVLDSPANLRRHKADINDVASIEVQNTKFNIRIHYTGAKIPNRIVSMIFDSIGPNRSGLRAVFQINIMPEVENIPKEETISLVDPSYFVLRDGQMVKEIRQGTKLTITCDSCTFEYDRTRMYKTRNAFTKVLTETISHDRLKDKNHVNSVLAYDLTDERKYVNKFPEIITNNRSYYKLIYLKPFDFYAIKGYNNSVKEHDVVLSEDRKSFHIKDPSMFSIDVPSASLRPQNCLNEVIDQVGNVIKLKEHFGRALITNITRSMKIADLSKVISYNDREFGCKHNDVSTSPSMYFTVAPKCDFRTSEYMDKNGISCTLFVHQSEGHIYIYKDKDVVLNKQIQSTAPYYLENPDTMSLKSEFKVYQDFAGSRATVEETDEYIKVQMKYFELLRNPLFFLLKSKGEISNIVRIYLHNQYPNIISGTLMRQIKYKSERGIWHNYALMNFRSKRMALTCGDMAPNTVETLTLFPKGKNTVYRTVPDVSKHHSEFETVQFEDLFGSSGITILKKPETENDLEIVLDNDYEITADHYRPIYFICAKDESIDQRIKKAGDYVVVSVDPLYSKVDYKGCGVRSDVFTETGNRKSENECGFDLSKDKNVRFHCPDYVPEHFLQGDQEQFKPDESDSGETNPFQSLIRCYDRSSFLARLFYPNHQVDILEKKKSVSELRSMWKIDEGLVKKQGLSSVLCICYDKLGVALSKFSIKA